MRKVLFLMLVIATQFAQAHPGHGEGSALIHESEHLVWLLSAVLIVWLVMKMILARRAKLGADKNKIKR